jgi:hypothetical protein
VQDDFKCIETAPEVPCAIILLPAVVDKLGQIPRSHLFQIAAPIWLLKLVFSKIRDEIRLVMYSERMTDG